MPTLADSSYEGAGIGILIPVKKPAGNQDFDIDTRTLATPLPSPQLSVPRSSKHPQAAEPLATPSLRQRR